MHIDVTSSIVMLYLDGAGPTEKRKMERVDRNLWMSARVTRND